MNFKDVFIAELKRMFLLTIANKTTFLNSFVFFILSIFTLHLGIGADELKQSTAFGILATYLVFAIILTTGIIFEDDYKNGITDEQLIVPAPFEIFVIAKHISYCLTLIVVSIVASPLAALFLNINTANIPLLLLTASLVVFNQVSICILASSLTLGANSTSLLSILVLPLSLPVIICANLVIDKPSILFLLLGTFIFIFPLSIVLTKLAVKNIR